MSPRAGAGGRVPPLGRGSARRVWKAPPGVRQGVAAQFLLSVRGVAGTEPDIPLLLRRRDGGPVSAARAHPKGLDGAEVTLRRGESLPVKPLISLDPRGGPPSGDHLMRSAARR
jgi:hypothetical protein